jgi:hypothetical protein
LRNPLKVDSSGRNKIFYVGLSIYDNPDGRPLVHQKEASGGEVGYNPHKNRTIQMILKNGLEPEVEIVDIGISKEQAVELEIFMIAFLGRKAYDKGGILCNITKGGDGNTSERTPEELARLKQAVQDHWDSKSPEEKKAHGDLMIDGLKKKLETDPEFRKAYSEAMRQTALNRPDLQEVARKARAAVSDESFKLGRKKSAANIKAQGLKRDRVDCPHCGENTAVNNLAAYHGEGKCTGDKSLRKDITGNKGKYPRIRASCTICRMETTTARLNVHLKKTHGV